MVEAIVEGGGVIAGLALLLYFQVIRPGVAEPRAGSALPRRPDSPEPPA